MMGLQLIFVVETNKKCKSDWIYIKETIEKFYDYNQAQVKLSVVYMDGKWKYMDKEREISKLKAQYAATSKTNLSKVIYCFDCDDYDINREDEEFLKQVQKYCEEHEYDRFCKDIERVYLGKKIENNQKKKESETFKKKKTINNIDIHKLSADKYRPNTSNIMKILDKHLQRK